jgi:hypothetical protein
MALARTASAVEPPVSGEPLRVTQNGGVGYLASPEAYTTVPLGAASVSGGARPDLFTTANNGVTKSAYLYRYLRDEEDGRPVFAPPVPVKHPLGPGGLPTGRIYAAKDGTVYGLFIDGKSLTRCRFDPKANAFVEAGQIKLPTLPDAPGSLGILSGDDARLELAFTVEHGGKAPEGDRTSDDFSVFDGAGLYRGVWPYVGIYRATIAADLSKVIEPPRLWSKDRREIRISATITGAFDVAGQRGVIATARFGNMYFFPDPGDATTLGERRMVTDEKGVVLRHPTTGGQSIPYPSRDGRSIDIITGGEGPLYYYRSTGKVDARGTPIFEQPTPVWQQDAELYAGSLAIPTLVDWNGDGAQDLIVGNSPGQVLFFKNFGSDAVPSFGLSERVRACGREIELQQGYWSVQNITEARWGYACPTVFDWNGDGLPDLIVGSALQEHFVYLNVGTRTEPKLDQPIVLQNEGVTLTGGWRTRPGVTRIGDRIAYVMQDEEHQLARYWRIDNANVMPDGPMRLTTGAPINIAVPGEGAGQKGRPTIELADWDGDGVADCFIGTAKRGGIPEPEFGLPWYRRNRKGPEALNMQLVYMRNAGTDAEPRYEYPQQLTFRGRDFYLGAHNNSAVVCKLGTVEAGQPNLLIGIESGRICFYQHKDIGFAPRPATKPAAKKVAAGNAK